MYCTVCLHTSTTITTMNLSFFRIVHDNIELKTKECHFVPIVLKSGGIKHFPDVTDY